MALFTKTNDAEFLKEARREEEELATLGKKLQKLEGRWSELQDECERIESQRDAQSGSYAKEVCQEFWDARSGALERRFEEAVARRDALTADLCPPIAALKKRVDGRNLRLVQLFKTWINRCPPTSPRRVALEKFYKTAEAAKSATEIVGALISAAELAKGDPDIQPFDHRKINAALSAAA